MVFAIGLFPSVLLSRMHDAVTGVVGRYVDGRIAYQDHRGRSDTVLEPLSGGPTEVGYPQPPTAPAAPAEAPSVARMDTGHEAAGSEGAP